MSENKLKEQMNKSINTAINKYNAAVFVLNGGSITEALAKFNYNVGGKSLRVFCRSANPEGYKSLQETKENRSWYSEHSEAWYYNDVCLYTLRKNKHLFIGEAE